MKKLVALVLALVMALSAGFAVTASAEPETVDLKLYRAIFSASPQGTLCEEEWEKMMEDYLGVNLNITWEELPYGEYNSKISVYMAAGDWADAFQISGYSISDVYEFGKQGLLANLKDYLPEDSYYMNFVNASAKNTANAYASDGGLYAFLDGAVSTTDNGTQQCWGVRFDVLEENGIAIPTSLEEIYDVAVQLKKLYPDSYPVSIGYGDLERWLLLYGTASTTMYDGESYVYAPYRKADEMYKVIEYLNKLMSEGLLDPEWQSDTQDQYFTKMLTDKTFITSFVYGSIFAERLNFNTEYDVEWGMIQPPTKLDGTVGMRSSYHEIGKFLNTGYASVVNAASPHVELLVKMLDYQYSDEIVDLTNWGIKGLTYDVDENGNKYYTDLIMSAEQPPVKLAEYGVNQSMSVRSGLLFIPQLHDAGAALQTPSPYYFNGEKGSLSHWNFYSMIRGELDNVLPVDPPTTSLTDVENEDMSINKTALDTYVDEELAKFVNGTRSLDTWEDFIAQMPNYGDIELIENIYNSHIVTE